MSVRLMSQVWELDLSHGQQAVLLAMADHADDNGVNCYPSVPYLAWKVGYSESQVQRILALLKAAGLIEPIAYAHGGRGKATEYRIHPEKGRKKQPLPENPRNLRPFADDKRVASQTKTPANPTQKGRIAMTPQPSENHHSEPGGAPNRKNSAAKAGARPKGTAAHTRPMEHDKFQDGFECAEAVEAFERESPEAYRLTGRLVSANVSPEIFRAAAAAFAAKWPGPAKRPYRHPYLTLWHFVETEIQIARDRNSRPQQQGGHQYRREPLKEYGQTF